MLKHCPTNFLFITDEKKLKKTNVGQTFRFAIYLQGSDVLVPTILVL